MTTSKKPNLFPGWQRGCLLIVAVVFAVPVGMIWSINAVFDAGITITWDSWLGMGVLCAFVVGSAGVPRFGSKS